MQALLHVALDLHELHHVLPTYKLVQASMGQSMTVCHEKSQSKHEARLETHSPPACLLLGPISNLGSTTTFAVLLCTSLQSCTLP